MLPKRVGVPKENRVGFRELRGLNHRDVREGGAGSFRAGAFERFLADQLRHLPEVHVGSFHFAGSCGDGFGHAVDVAVHTVENDVNLDSHLRFSF
jgi:hypothetical protein